MELVGKLKELITNIKFYYAYNMVANDRVGGGLGLKV